MFELVRQGRRLTHGAHRRRRPRGRHRRARRGRLDDAARALDRHRAPDGGRQGLQLLGPADGRAVARDPARRRPRRLHAVRRAHPHRRHDGVQRHQQPPRPPPDRLDRRRRARSRSSRGSRRRSRRSGPGCGRSPPTGCRCSTAPATFDNTYIATGYSMQGVTLAPPSGRGAGRDDRDRQAAAAARAVPARPLPARSRCPPTRRLRTSRREPRDRRLRVAIIGSGNIGTDLMMKVERSPALELAGMAGIDPESDGLRAGARARPSPSPPTGLAGLLDAGRGASTSRSTRPRPERMPSTPGCWPSAGSRSVDLTPAALGPAVVPPVNLGEHARRAPRSTWSPAARRRRSRSWPRSPRVADVSLRRDRLDHLVALGRPGHPPEHRRVHDRRRRAGWRRSAAPTRPRRSSS